MEKVHTGDNLHAPKGKTSLPQKSLGQKVKMLLASIPFFVTAIVTPGCSNEQKKIEKGNTSGSNPKVEQVVA